MHPLPPLVYYILGVGCFLQITGHILFPVWRSQITHMYLTFPRLSQRLFNLPGKYNKRVGNQTARGVFWFYFSSTLQ